MLTELDVINGCLATMGEIPLVELIDDHPLVASARQEFRDARIAETARRWWFNTDYITLAPANGVPFVYVPEDAVEVTPLDRTDLTRRGRRLYNRMTGTYEINSPVRCLVVRDIPFEDLPVPAMLLVKHATVLRFQLNYDADENKTAKLEGLYNDAYSVLNAEHTRQIALNPLQMLSVMQKRMSVGMFRRTNHFPVR